jgi:hypothetical protein
MRKRFPGIPSFLCLAVCSVAVSLVAEDRVPIQADLVRPLEAGQVKVGDPVLAKVAAKWKGHQCTLRQGAILQGRVVNQSAHSRTANTSEIALLFESGQCDGRDMKPLSLTVAAVLAVDPRRDPNMYENQSLSDAVGLGVGGGAVGAAGGLGGGGSFRSATATASIVDLSPPRYKGPTAVMPGQIIGIKGMKLNVGGGPEGSSVLSLSGRNVRLESGAQLMLVPNLNAAPPAAAGAAPTSSAPSVSATTETKVPEADAVDETEICSPPLCSPAHTSAEAEPTGADASAVLSIKELGYARPGHELNEFDHDSAIAYLGQKQLLFTFNPHVLVERTDAEAKVARLRVIRAVLIDVQSKRVEKAVDWKVLDAQQYLWPVGHDKVMVHVGRELRLYGPGLKLEQRLSLNGPLAFMCTSPSSTYFAVGVVQERHPEAVHRQLEEAEAREPEEDVEIKVLNREFHALATVVRSSRAALPVLSDNGEIRVLRMGKNRWQIVEDSWDVQKHVLTQVNSTCRPEVTTLPPNLFFVVGCDHWAVGKWYRVLRYNGKPVLKGWSPSAELEHTAGGSAAGSAFTIRIAEAAKSVIARSSFRPSDLEEERIAVYRTENGERVFTVTIPSPVPTVQTFALSPDAGQLAILQGDQIAFYELPNATDPGN